MGRHGAAVPVEKHLVRLPAPPCLGGRGFLSPPPGASWTPVRRFANSVHDLRI